MLHTQSGGVLCIRCTTLHERTEMEHGAHTHAAVDERAVRVRSGGRRRQHGDDN